jgi:sugar fermentation stimulation protein A
MRFPDALVRGTLIRRYKRFLADIEMADGGTITAHVANPGSMIGLTEPGAEVWLSPNRNPKAKLDWRWELVRVDGHLVGVNTAHPNRLVADALAEGRIPELTGYGALRREVRYGENSRIDILLESENGPSCHVEIKNVHLMRQAGLAEFPDSVTARGTKHLGELSRIAEAGGRAVMFYLVQRGDCQSFTVASDIDPAYATALRAALASGVEALCYDCEVTTEGIALAKPLSLSL